MGTNSRLATILDVGMIGPARIRPASTPIDQLPTVTDLAGELGGRYLLRYLASGQVGRLRGGVGDPQFVTPTPYAPEETISWLALPAPTELREFVLLLQPERLTDVVGPKWVWMGGGIEYVLLNGFSADAIVDMAPGSAVPARWEIEVR